MTVNGHTTRGNLFCAYDRTWRCSNGSAQPPSFAGSNEWGKQQKYKKSVSFYQNREKRSRNRFSKKKKKDRTNIPLVVSKRSAIICRTAPTLNELGGSTNGNRSRSETSITIWGLHNTSTVRGQEGDKIRVCIIS